jgi:hypothetical protein
MRQTLANEIGLNIIDQFSVDTLTLEIVSQNNVVIERYLLKATSSPSPRKEVYENIPCSVIRPTVTSQRIAVILLDSTPFSLSETLSRVLELVSEGYTFFHVELSMQASPASIIAQIVKGISYASLRRDIVDHLYLWGVREVGIWGIFASIFDERLKGIILDGVPTSLGFPKVEKFPLSRLCEGIAPRPLAIINVPNIETAFRKVSDCYRKLQKITLLRLEERWEPPALKDLFAWLTTKRCES